MTTCTKVRELEFCDLYLGHPSLSDSFSEVPGAVSNPLTACPALRADLDCLAASCRTEHRKATGPEFRVVHDDVTYRVAPMPSLGGTTFVLRKMASTVRSLPELGIPQAYIRHLLRNDLSGLIVVSGAIASGKTMTACAMLKDRLTQHGGVAVTREKPVELPLEGMHGQGVCFQTEAPAANDTTADGLRSLARWHARMVLIDEIRDSDTALEVLRASVNGQLFITTMLAEGVTQTIVKLQALVQQKIAATEARMLLAEGLLGVLHQKLTRGTRPSLETEFLFLKDAPHIRGTLREGNYERLKSDIQKQMASMIAENGAASRNRAG